MKTLASPIIGRQPRIVFKRVKPFRNKCAVTGGLEWCNAEIEYIPRKRIIDIVEYRKWFDKDFNELIEVIAMSLFNEIIRDVEPEFLRVRVYLENNPDLTDWYVEFQTEQPQ